MLERAAGACGRRSGNKGERPGAQRREVSGRHLDGALGLLLLEELVLVLVLVQVLVLVLVVPLSKLSINLSSRPQLEGDSLDDLAPAKPGWFQLPRERLFFEQHDFSEFVSSV